MKQFFITVAGVIAGMFAFIFLLFFLLAAIGAAASAGSSKSGPTVLELDLRGGIVDHPVAAPLFGSAPPSTVGIVRGLERAKTDKSVKGVFIRAESFGLAPATAEELRLALIDFKESGKFVIAQAQGIDNTSVIPYQVIAPADEIWLQASTGFAASGLHAEYEFLGGVMEKIGAKPQFVRHGDYKTAVNSYTESGFTDAHRESAESLLGSLFTLATDNIAEDRGIEKAELMRLLESAPHTAEAAMEAGLVDKLGYLEEVRDYIREKAGDEDTVFKSIADYKGKANIGKPVIAFVGGQGPILPGKSDSGSPFSPAMNMGGETLAAGLDAALEDEDVKAIVFRVSSPGGSAAASDQILAAAKRAQDAGKPLVISMGQYAASGGYYVAASADHIVAMPQTITGSIGVFGGKVALEDTFAKVGYNIEAITFGGDYAGAYSSDTPFNQAQLAGYARSMDDIYDEFVGLVAEGRDMTREEVIAIAEGRVWTGAQALENGLVDELGGIHTAIDAAKRLAEIDEGEEVRLKTFPRQPTQEEQFEALFSASAKAGQDASAMAELMKLPEVQAALRARDVISQAGERELEATLPRF